MAQETDKGLLVEVEATPELTAFLLRTDSTQHSLMIKLAAARRQMSDELSDVFNHDRLIRGVPAARAVVTAYTAYSKTAWDISYSFFTGENIVPNSGDPIFTDTGSIGDRIIRNRAMPIAFRRLPWVTRKGIQQGDGVVSKSVSKAKKVTAGGERWAYFWKYSVGIFPAKSGDDILTCYGEELQLGLRSDELRNMGRSIIPLASLSSMIFPLNVEKRDSETTSRNIRLYGIHENPSRETVVIEYSPSGKPLISYVGRTGRPGDDFVTPARAEMAALGMPKQEELPKSIKDFGETWNTIIEKAARMEPFSTRHLQ